jgi:hypothetical protein
LAAAGAVGLPAPLKVDLPQRAEAPIRLSGVQCDCPAPWPEQ